MSSHDHIYVRSRTGRPYNRAGRRWGTDWERVEKASLTREQGELLANDPHLQVSREPRGKFAEEEAANAGRMRLFGELESEWKKRAEAAESEAKAARKAAEDAQRALEAERQKAAQAADGPKPEDPKKDGDAGGEDAGKGEPPAGGSPTKESKSEKSSKK